MHSVSYSMLAHNQRNQRIIHFILHRLWMPLSCSRWLQCRDDLSFLFLPRKKKTELKGIVMNLSTATFPTCAPCIFEKWTYLTIGMNTQTHSNSFHSISKARTTLTAPLQKWKNGYLNHNYIKEFFHVCRKKKCLPIVCALKRCTLRCIDMWKLTPLGRRVDEEMFQWTRELL